MKRWRHIAIVVAAAAAMTGGALPAAPQDAPTTQSSELVARVKFTKEQFVELTAKMLEVARLLEKTEPETARVLRQTVNQARRAFITEEMGKVAELLGRGLAAAAAETETEVLGELRKVLATLLHGTMDLDKRMERVRKWKEFLAKIGKLIEKQESLERSSHTAARADELDAQMKALSARLGEIVSQQKKLLAAAERLAPGDAAVMKLSELRDRVADLVARQDRLNKAVKTMTVDKLPLAGEAQKALRDKAAAVQKAAAAAAKDPDLAKALSQAGAKPDAAAQAAKSLARAGGEMQKAAGALGESNAGKAAAGQAQALADLKAAEKALADAVKKASEKTPAGKLADKQAELAAKSAELGEAIRSAAKQARMQADAGNVSKAAAQMQQAARKLAGQNAPGARKHQKEALKLLSEQEYKLAELHRRIMEEATKPTDRQAEEQSDLAEKGGRLSEQMKQPNGGQPAPGQPHVQSASKSMGKAASQLGGGKSGQANSSQSEALNDLDKARRQLDEAIAQEQEMLQAESLARIDAMLQRILDAQKSLSADTKSVAAKRRDAAPPYARAEQLKLAELSLGEGRLAEDVGKVRQMLVKEGTTAVFPAVLGEVRGDLANVEKLLADKDAGELTQGIQAEIERSLREMIDAIRKELSHRRRKGAGGAGGAEGGGGGGGGKAPLVPMTAELKMLRLLQLQINGRTALLDRQKAKAPPPADAIRRQIKLLSERQAKLGNMATELNKKQKARGPRPGGRRR